MVDSITLQRLSLPGLSERQGPNWSALSPCGQIGYLREHKLPRLLREWGSD